MSFSIVASCSSNTFHVYISLYWGTVKIACALCFLCSDLFDNNQIQTAAEI